MTLAELVALVRQWQTEMPPEEARAACDQLARRTTIGLDDLPVGAPDPAALWAVAASDKPADETALATALLRGPDPPPPRKTKRRRAPVQPPAEPAPAAPLVNVPAEPAVVSEPAPAVEIIPPANLRGRPSKRARALVREQLANGPRPGDEVLAAADVAQIPEWSLIAAANALGVRTRRGQWWLPDPR